MNAITSSGNDERPLDLSILRWIEEAVGKRLLAYVLDCEVGILPALSTGDNMLSEKQRAVVDLLVEFRAKFPSGLDELNIKLTVGRYLTQADADGKTLAALLHGHVTEDMSTGGIPTGQDDLERVLIALAVDAYPLLLLPPNPALPVLAHKFGPHIAGLLFNHPQQVVFGEAILRDAVLGNVYASQGESSGHIITVPRGTDEHNQQLLLVSDMLLRAAWRKLEVQKLNLTNFVAAALQELNILRAVYAGERKSAAARIAFTGVLLPPGRELRLAEGTVRAVNDQDRRSAPESLKGQLDSTNASGESTVINYDGDVLFEFQAQLEPQPSSPGILGRWPSDLEQSVTRLRFSLLLAAQRGHRVQLVETWRAIDMPLTLNMALSWHDPRQGSGLSAVQLIESDLQTWGEWYVRLSDAPVSIVEITLTRILRAVAERREPSDVLIDSVIAWESIFGTKCGLTKCLTTLLERDTKARQARKKGLDRIYDLRSKVVHGGGTLDVKDHSICEEALDVAIEAMRILVANYPNILRAKDGAERSKLLLSV
jgi:Apea-like HEPN